MIERLKNYLSSRAKASVAISLALLIVDLCYRLVSTAWVRFSVRVLMAVRVAVYGAVLGGTFALGLSVVTRMAVFAPGHPDALNVAMVWGVAAIMGSVFGVTWLLIRSLTAIGFSLSARIGEAMNRPIIVDRERAEAAPAPPPRKAPANPGSGDFVGYTDSQAYINEMREDLLTKGISGENLAEILKEIGKGTEA